MLKVTLNALIERLHPFCLDALQNTAALCAQKTHYEVGIEHLLLSFCKEPESDIAIILRHFGITPDTVAGLLELPLAELPVGNTGRPAMSPLLVELFQDAWLTASIELSQRSIRSGALLLAILGSPTDCLHGQHAAMLRNIPRQRLLDAYDTITAASCEADSHGRSNLLRASSLSSDSEDGQSALQRFCTDLAEQAQKGAMDPVFGRDREMRQLIDILARRKKNNPILVGDAGVGKTAVVEGLALRIAAGDVPEQLKDVHILTLDLGLLEAGAGMKGEFENRLKSVIQEIGDADYPIILFIDEAHVLIGAGGRAGGHDAANLLKPALARGELRTIAATTWPEYKKYFEKDQALTRRFQTVRIEEPDRDATLDILRGLKTRYEQDHGVTIRDDALVAATELSRRYITGRMLPDKAVDVLDTAAARVKINLSHPPEELDDLERTIDKVRRAITTLEEDLRKGAPMDRDGLAGLRSRLAVLEDRALDLRQRWRKQQLLVQEILALRQNLADAPPDLEERLEGKLRQLQELQGDDPLLRHEVDPEVVARVIADWTGVPLGKLLRDHAQTVLALETALARRIRGQRQALDIISGTIKAATSGLRAPSQPLGVFLLVGPSGVGKTETALALADIFFGDEASIVAINMSEFQERHTVSRLIGSPPGYVGYGEGGLLTEAVRRRPFCVLLLDEAEKANPEVLHLFLQVFDKGVLTDGEGREVDFSNTLIFLTSNVGAEALQELHEQQQRGPVVGSGVKADVDPGVETDVESDIESDIGSVVGSDHGSDIGSNVGSGVGSGVEQALTVLRPQLLEHFKPALLARLTITPYFPLDLDVLTEIAALKLQRLAAQLQSGNGMGLDYAEDVPRRIAERSRLLESGARGIDHVLALDVLPSMSQRILEQMQMTASPRSVRLETGADGGFALRFEG